MAAYQMFTSTRQTDPDPVALLTAVRAIDATAGISRDGQSYRVKTNATLSANNIAAVQAAIDTAPALTSQRAAQNEIDNWPISQKALVLALIDQLNVIRAALPTPLGAITPGQALNAVRAKAGTL